MRQKPSSEIWGNPFERYGSHLPPRSPLLEGEGGWMGGQGQRSRCSRHSASRPLSAPTPNHPPARRLQQRPI